jgi:hypothetical protein
MRCLLCSLPILTGQEVHQHHHEILKSQGGTETAPVHGHCHRAHHSNRGEFRQWGSEGGQRSALTRRWSFNLQNVRSNPAFDFDRAYYLALYAH